MHNEYRDVDLFLLLSTAINMTNYWLLVYWMCNSRAVRDIASDVAMAAPLFPANC